MALEHSINQENFDKLGETIQEHYAKEGDNYFLQANGMSPKSKVEEFRNENIKTRQENEKLTGTISDLNAKIKTLDTGTDEEKIKQSVEEGIKKRTTAMQEEHDKLLSEAVDGRSVAEKSLSSLLISEAVTREAMSAGVKDAAVTDVLTRAKNVFKVVKGKAVAYDGEDPIYGKDGTTPLSMKDWLAGQAAQAPHLFKESSGSGAENNQGGGAAKKEMSRGDFESKNPADQMSFVKSGGKITD